MDTQPILILVNGLPGTGKSTLAARLSKDLSLPCMGKDMLKEFFYDTLGIKGLEQSRMIGRAVFDMLYVLVETYLSHGKSIMIECPFFVEFSRPKLQAIIDQYPAQVVEVYCRTDKMERRRRVTVRAESGNRHQAHIDAATSPALDEPEPLDVYAPLEIGGLISVDTTNFGDDEYRQLVEDIRSRLRA